VFNLPDPGRYRLAHPPLALAVVQVQFPIIGRLQELAGITPIQEELRAAFPYMERLQTQQFTLAIGPGAIAQPPLTETSIGWKFSDDHGWSLLIEPGTATVSIGSNYESIDEFAQRVELLLTSLHNAGGVRRCDRIGVRYVNLAAVTPDDQQEWVHWFREELAGWIAMPVFANDTVLDSSISQTTLHSRPTGNLSGSPHQVNGVVRHGLLPAGTAIPVATVTPLQPLAVPSFILDIDIFSIGPQPFDIPSLARQFRQYHSEIDRFFRWSLAAAGEARFGVIAQ
jgi:uncharacterized protein (TIGR04255 family)